MLILGIICVVVAVVLIALGVINAAVHVLIWIGVGLVILGAVFYLLSRRGPRTPV